MKMSENSFVKLLLVMGVLASIYVSLTDKPSESKTWPEVLVNSPVPEKVSSPVIQIQTTPAKWEETKDLVIKLSSSDQQKLDILYDKTNQWIAEDKANFENVFRNEILDTPKINLTVAFFLMTSTLRYFPNPGELLNKVLSKEIPKEMGKEADHHLHGNSSSEQFELLKLHALTEMQENPQVDIDEDLKNTLIETVKTTPNLSLVRETILLLKDREEVDDQELALMTSKRPKSDSFAFSDLL